MAIRTTHSVKILDIVDMFLYVDLVDRRRTGAFAGARYQGHSNWGLEPRHRKTDQWIGVVPLSGMAADTGDS